MTAKNKTIKNYSEIRVTQINQKISAKDCP